MLRGRKRLYGVYYPYMNWAAQRKLTYMTIVLVVLGMIGFLLFRHFTNVEPTCYDVRKNGDEKGIDCGGKCSLYCANEVSAPKVRWVRSFKITNSVVHAVAYIEHSNATAAASSVGYTFKLYDTNNTVLAERKGSTFLGPIGRTAIVETLIPIGNVPVARTTITFDEPILWQRIPVALVTATIKSDRTMIEQYAYSDIQKGTRLSAVIENTSRYNYTNLDVVAVLFDTDDNVITATKALVPRFEAESMQTVTFTWPFSITVPVARTEIVTRFNPFTAESL